MHVTWSADDSGSGVDASTCRLEVREDEGTWQTFSTECAGDDTYDDGEPGYTYTFRLTASDNVGNDDSLEAEAVVPYAKKYYYANGQRVAMREGDVVYYIHTDHLGSTSVLSEGDGEPMPGSRVAYLPYGGLRLGDASTLPTDYGFTGQRLEAGIGLMHYGARFYSPRLGRFVSADTIVPSPLNPQDFNRYTYGRNNPLVYIDADGHFVVPVIIALAVVAAGIAFFRTPACAGEGCAPGTSGNSLEYQIRSYATAVETAVEVRLGAELLAGQLLAETRQDENRGQKEAAEEVVEETEKAIEQGAKEVGNIFHYDQLNGGTGTGGPSQLQERYRDTQFRFTPRGVPGEDVEYIGGKHPSQYPDSSWPEGFNRSPRDGGVLQESWLIAYAMVSTCGYFRSLLSDVTRGQPCILAVATMI